MGIAGSLRRQRAQLMESAQGERLKFMFPAVITAKWSLMLSETNVLNHEIKIIIMAFLTLQVFMEIKWDDEYL